MRTLSRRPIAAATIGAASLAMLLSGVNHARAAIAACGPATRLHLEIVIDDSGSMRTNDPGNLRAAASRLAVASLPNGDIAGAITFGKTASALFAPTTLSADNRAPLLATFDSLNGSGAASTGTLFKPAIELAKTELAKTSADRKALIFLSDGQPGDPLQGSSEQLGSPIFSVGLGPGPFDSLKKIAQETGGSFAQAATANDLGAVFSNIVSSLRCTDTSGAFNDTLAAGQSVSHPVVIKGGTAELSVRSSWPLGRFSVTFTSPKGLAYTTPGTYPGGAVVTDGGTFTTFSIPKPKAGTWKITITALAGTSGGKVTTQLDTRLLALKVSALKAKPALFATSTKLRFRLNAPGKLRVLVTKVGSKKALRAYTVTGKLGANTLKFTRVRKGKSLAPGKYTVRVRPATLKKGGPSVKVTVAP